MSFQPIVPFAGYSGWLFLERTVEAQRVTFSESSKVVRETENFREKIGSITTAQDLMNDRQLLTVSLGAFGLDDDINNTFFIRKVLEEGTTESDALANKLSDPQYAEFSKAFGFGDAGVANTRKMSFADDIIVRFETEQFNKAVGEQNNDMRLALNYSNALERIASRKTSNNAQWFAIMGNAPLRNTVQTALGFPSSFGTIDIDQQLVQFKSRAEATFGSDILSDLASPENQEKMIRLYMLRSESNSANATSSASVALSLLRQI